MFGDAWFPWCARSSTREHQDREALEARLRIVEADLAELRGAFVAGGGDAGARDRALAQQARANARLLDAQAEALEIKNAASRPPPADRGVVELQGWSLDTAEPERPRVTLMDQEGRAYTFASTRAHLHDVAVILSAATGPTTEGR